MTEPAAQSPGRHTRHWLVVAGAACMMIAGQFVFLSASILNPPLARSLGVGLSEVMVFNSLMAVSGVISMTFVAPRLLKRFGVRANIIGGGPWMAASLGSVALVRGVALLYVLGFAAGLTMGMATMLAASLLVNTWFESSRGTVMGVVFAVSGLGGIGAGLVLPAIVSSTGWQSGFAVIAALVVLLVVLPGVFLVRSDPADVGLRPFGARDVPPTADGAPVVVPGVPARIAFRTPQFAAFAVAIVLFGMVQAVQQHFASLFVERGVALAAAGTLISLMALATVASNITLGTLNDRRGTLPAVLLALACQVLSMVGYLVASGFVPLAASTVVFAFAAAFPGVFIPILVMLLFGVRDYTAILGPAIALMPAGMAIGTPLWGVAVDLGGSYDVALVASAVGTVAIALLLAWAIRTAPALRRRVARELGQG